MKKILFLTILCLFLTGCTVNYNLEINDDTFKETITGDVLNIELDNGEEATDINNYDHFLTAEQPVFKKDNSTFYNKSLNNTTNGIEFEYSYSFNENNFINSRILNGCFDNYNFKVEDNKYYIQLSGQFKCNYTDTKINLTTDYKVIAHNADKKKKNTYTWTIEKDNSQDVDLFISIDKNETNNNFSLGWNIFKTIGLIILLILSSICIYFLKKKEQY